MSGNIVSVHLSDDIKGRLDHLSQTTGRTARALSEEAIEAYLNQQEWQMASIDEAIAVADEGKFVSHDAMSLWLKSWGTDEELLPPANDIFKSTK